MARKIIGVVIILSVLAISIIGFVYFKQKTHIGINYWNVIPNNAVMIVKAPSFHRMFSKLNTNNIIWQEFKSVPFFNEVNLEGEYLDSIFNNNNIFSEALATNNAILSMHFSGKNKIHFLYTLPINKSIGIKNIIDEIAKIKMYKNNKSFEGYEISEIELRNNKKLHFTFIENVWIASASVALIEESIRQYKTGVPISENYELKKIIETSGANTDASVFVNVPLFINIAKQILNNEHTEKLFALSGFMGWVNLDATIKPNTLLLNGFTYCNDTAAYYLNLFSNQQPGEAEAINVMPDNTAWFWHLSVSNFSSWKLKREQLLQNKKEISKYKLKIEEWNKLFNEDVEEELTGWIGKEIVIGAVNQEPDSAAGNVFMFFRKSEERDAVKHLRQLASSAEGWYTEQYLDYEIQRLPIDSPFYYLLGNAYASLSKPYFTALSDYIVMANDIEVLKNIINFYQSSRTLSVNADYRQFAENISSESNMFFYCAMPYVFPSIQNMLNEEFKNSFTENAELLKKFQAFSWQISYSKKNLFYNSIYLKYNPVYKEKKSGLWNVELDAPITYGPYFFSNHTTNAKDIIVQDELDNLYLISNTGKIFWKKQLDGQVIGKVLEVDMLNNAKIQMLFNTANSIYIIDRKGNFFNNFPVKLPATACNSVAALDYEKNKTYRFVIACNNNKIYNYDMNGKPVEGWQIPTAQSIVSFPLFHFATQGKDYILVAENSGSVYALDRKGQIRLSFKNNIGHNGLVYFKAEPSVTFENVRVISLDSGGVFTNLNFSDKIDTLHLFSNNIPASFIYQDINNDKLNELILFQQGILKVLSEKKVEIFKHTFPGQAPGKVDVFSFNKNYLIGVLYEGTSEVFIYNAKGELMQGFPISVQNTYTAGDMNNDGILNIITTSGKNINAFNAE